MSHATFDEQWRDAMASLINVLEEENPEDPELAPQGMAGWARVYVKYVSIYRSLEECYDQMCHPQKRMDVYAALEATMGRMLEVKEHLQFLNGGDMMNLDDALLDLKATPEALELPLPRFVREDRSKELEDRKAFLDRLIEEYNVADPAAKGKKATGRSLTPLDPEVAIEMIQRNERGRQGRARVRYMANEKYRRMHEAQALQWMRSSEDTAATVIQAAARGFLARRQVRRQAAKEMEFLGMAPADKENEPQGQEMRVLARRKNVQEENRKDYERQLVDVKARVREQEGQEMRDAIQDKINAWFVQNRDPETGDYPDLPSAEEGGSKAILNPMPELEDSPPSEQQQQQQQQQKQGSSSGRNQPQQQQQQQAQQSSSEAQGTGEAKPVPPKHFRAKVQEALEEWDKVWKSRVTGADEGARVNIDQKADPNLTLEALRPVVFEEVRQEVDEEMRVLLQNLKEMVEAERAAKLGKKAKKPKKKGKKKGAKKGGKKGKKDPTAHLSIESLYAELVQYGIIKNPPKYEMGEYVCGWDFFAESGEPTMAQVRRAVTETAILPFASKELHANLRVPKALLLYGNPGTGKMLLALAVVNALGANLIDLSPANTDGLYLWKGAQELCHKAFKVAKVMAPSVVLIDDAEKVFLTGKKAKDCRIAGISGEQPGRIKKHLRKEVKGLRPGERVLTIGLSREPWLAVKKDEKALADFFTKRFPCPLPDYAARRALWPALFEREGVSLPANFDLSTLVDLSRGFSPGTMEHVALELLTPRRFETLASSPLSVSEVLPHLARFSPVSAESDQSLRNWEKRLAERSNPSQPKQPSQEQRQQQSRSRSRG